MTDKPTLTDEKRAELDAMVIRARADTGYVQTKEFETWVLANKELIEAYVEERQSRSRTTDTNSQE
jgi:hypothetical protein